MSFLRRRRRLVGGFSPLNYANLELWIDANDINTLSLTGALVDQWDDKSGNDRHFTASGGDRPTYSATALEGNLPSVSFAAGDNMTFPAEEITYTNFTFFAVVQRDTDGGGSQVFFRRYATREFQTLVNASDVWRIEASTDGSTTTDAISSTITATTGQKALYQARLDNSNLYLQVDDEAEQSDAMTSIHNASTVTRIGRASGADSLCTVSEIIFYSRDLSSTERSEIRAGLNAKSGVTI